MKKGDIVTLLTDNAVKGFRAEIVMVRDHPTRPYAVMVHNTGELVLLTVGEKDIALVPIESLVREGLCA